MPRCCLAACCRCHLEVPAGGAASTASNLLRPMGCRCCNSVLSLVSAFSSCSGLKRQPHHTASGAVVVFTS
jgi:hypothetical protein